MAFSTKKFSDFTKRNKDNLLLSSYFVGYQEATLKSEIRVPIIDLLNNVYNQTQTIVYNNSSTWDEASSSYIANSGNFQSTFITVSALSAGWGGLNSVKWDDTYTTVFSNSASWGDSVTILNSSSAKWDDTYTTLNTQSATWDSTSLLFNNYSPLWNDTSTTVQLYSGGWEDTKSTVFANSALWADNSSGVGVLSGNWQDTYTTVQTNSGLWQDTYATVQTNSGSWDSAIAINYADATFLPLTGGTLTGNLSATQSVAISGDLRVGQTGTLLFAGNNKVGINTDTPTEQLTVVGNISSTQVMYACGGNSDEWNSVYTTFKTVSSTFLTTPQTLAFNETTYDLSIASGNTVSLSALIDNTDLNVIKSLTGKWDNTYTTVNVNSGDWSYQGNDIKALTGNWQDTYTATQAYSGSWNDVFSTVQSYSATWDGSLASIANLSGNWENTYSVVLANSAYWSDHSDTAVRALTSNWQSTYTTVRGNSGSWRSTYTNVNTFSADWNDTHTVVANNSADWGYLGTDIKDLTGNWESTYTNVYNNSANWQDTYTLFSQQSSDNLAAQSVLAAGSAAWIDTNTTVWSYSAVWGNPIDVSKYDAVYNTVYLLSGSWDTTAQDVGNGITIWYDTASTVAANSANWDYAFTNQSNYLPIAGGIVTGNALFQQNVTIYGNLSCSGTQTFANTVFTTTSALSVVHFGSGPAMWIGNNGTGDIASFYDIDIDKEILHVGGVNSLYPYVGVNTSKPNKELTISGDVSASKVIYDAYGNSEQWNSVYSNVNANSAVWNAPKSEVSGLTGNWESTYSTVQTNSAHWSSVYSYVNTNSGTYVTTVATTTPGLSAVTKIVAVSALPVSPDPNTLYIVI